MNHDPQVYVDPENFRPERFLDETEQHEVIPSFTHGEVGAQRSIVSSCAASLTITFS